MDTNIQFWFQGFVQGIATLPQAQRECFFAECGKNCVQQGTLAFYQTLYETAQGDMDRFFEKISETPGVRSVCVEAGKSYHFYFEQCTCPLHQEGYVNTPQLCECSRQSVLFVLRTLWPVRTFAVTLDGTILSGAKECTLRVDVQ